MFTVLVGLPVQVLQEPQSLSSLPTILSRLVTFWQFLLNPNRRSIHVSVKWLVMVEGEVVDDTTVVAVAVVVDGEVGSQLPTLLLSVGIVAGKPPSDFFSIRLP